MNLAVATPTDFAALREVSSPHDAGYKTKQLARRRAHYAALFQRYQDALTIDDEGYEVSITIRSVSKSLTLTSAEAEHCFNLTELYGKLGAHLNALRAEIMDLLADPSAEAAGFEGTDEPLLHEALALCLPAAANDEARPTPANTSKAA